MYGLAELGDAPEVAILAEIAAFSQEEESDTALRSLKRMKGKGVNAAIVKALEKSEAPVRAMLARSLGDRNAYDSMDAIFQTALDKNVEVSVEAMKSLSRLAKADDMPRLVNLLTEVKDEQVRNQAEITVDSVAKKVSGDENTSLLLLKADSTQKSTAVKVSLIRTMGMIGNDSALDRITAYTKDNNAKIMEAAIEALSIWPSGTPANTLSKLAADKSQSDMNRRIALRGFINLIPKQAQLPDDRLIADFKNSIAMAGHRHEKKLILSKLAEFRNNGALKLAQQLGGDEAVKSEADVAVEKIQKLLSNSSKAIASHNPAEAYKGIDGKPETRWSTGWRMNGGEWFQIELAPKKVITGIVLDCKGSDGDYPRGYEIYISMNSFGQGYLLASGKGIESVVDITFDRPVSGRTLKIIQTGKSGGSYWTICELKLKTKLFSEK